VTLNENPSIKYKDNIEGHHREWSFAEPDALQPKSSSSTTPTSHHSGRTCRWVATIPMPLPEDKSDNSISVFFCQRSPSLPGGFVLEMAQYDAKSFLTPEERLLD
jgi:hypothetical protein